MTTRYYRIDFTDVPSRKLYKSAFREFVDDLNLGQIGHGIGALNLAYGPTWFFGYTPVPRFHPGVEKDRKEPQLIQGMESGLADLKCAARREFDIGETLKDFGAYEDARENPFLNASVLFYAIKMPEASPDIYRPDNILSQIRQLASQRGAGRVAEGNRTLQVATDDTLFISYSLDRSYRSDNLEIRARKKSISEEEKTGLLKTIVTKRQALTVIFEEALDKLPYSWTRFDLERLLNEKVPVGMNKASVAKDNGVPASEEPVKVA